MGAFCAWERSCFQLQLLVKGSCLPSVVGSVLSLQDPARVTLGQLHFPARSTGADGLTSRGEFLLTLAINYGYCASILECKPIKIIIFRWAYRFCCEGCLLLAVLPKASLSISWCQHQLLLLENPSGWLTGDFPWQHCGSGSLTTSCSSHTVIILVALGVCSCR